MSMFTNLVSNLLTHNPYYECDTQSPITYITQSHIIIGVISKSTWRKSTWVPPAHVVLPLVPCHSLSLPETPAARLRLLSSAAVCRSGEGAVTLSPPSVLDLASPDLHLF